MNISSLSSEQLAQPCTRSSHLAPSFSNFGKEHIWRDTSFDYSVNQMTDNSSLCPILSLQFPMMMSDMVKLDGNKLRNFKGARMDQKIG